MVLVTVGDEIAGAVHFAQRQQKAERERRHHDRGEGEAEAVAQVEQRAQDHQHRERADAERDRTLRALAAQGREQHRADRADGCGFGRGRKPDQDRAEHHDDQQHRRDQRLEHAGERALVRRRVSRIGGTAAGRTIATATMKAR